ncbi:transposase [Streptomyces sp. NBC_00841]|uniref:transposase n=1 Tax=Streptomyces sp. NBC_00841 TaxID=2975847 RepID=UPI002DD98DB9|nr:transposase [Streptomyces sp. NBC_00841]WSA04217.1 transposase [Streptomyces sp. NBC_00841]
MRCRIDFKYALAMGLDDPGFHHSVLGDFRDRLAQGDRADRLMDLALARLKDAGLVRERTTQRTDSTHVLAAVRDLTRLELITEAVRAALEALAGNAPHLLTGLVEKDWGRPLRPSGPWARTPPGPRRAPVAAGLVLSRVAAGTPPPSFAWSPPSSPSRSTNGPNLRRY